MYIAYQVIRDLFTILVLNNEIFFWNETSWRASRVKFNYYETSVMTERQGRVRPIRVAFYKVGLPLWNIIL